MIQSEYQQKLSNMKRNSSNILKKFKMNDTARYSITRPFEAEQISYFALFMFNPNEIVEDITKIKLQIISGSCKGTISENPRGKGGFGWDSVFIPSKECLSKIPNGGGDVYIGKTFSEIIDYDKEKYNKEMEVYNNEMAKYNEQVAKKAETNEETKDIVKPVKPEMMNSKNMISQRKDGLTNVIKYLKSILPN
jgi:hypothetical protein